MKQILPIFALALLVLVGCKSTKRAYEKGEYEKAVLNSIDRLRNSPDNKKSRETLSLAYPELLGYVQDNIKDAKLGGDPLKWEYILGQYEILNRVYDQIRLSPAARDIISNPQNFSREYEESKTKAAEARYQLGVMALDRGRDGDRSSAKEAYYHFQKAGDLRTGYRNSMDLALEAKEWATIFVEIEPIPMHSQQLKLTNHFLKTRYSNI